MPCKIMDESGVDPGFLPCRPGAAKVGAVVDSVVLFYAINTAPGIYKIVIERPDPESTNTVRSNPVIVTVTK